jgi:hypothetical protein
MRLRPSHNLVNFGVTCPAANVLQLDPDKNKPRLHLNQKCDEDIDDKRTSHTRDSVRARRYKGHAGAAVSAGHLRLARTRTWTRRTHRKSHIQTAKNFLKF